LSHTGRRLALACALLAGAPAWGGVRKLAVVAGNNEGRVSAARLYFAEDDARKVADVLMDLGGYERRDVELLLGERRPAFLEALVDARAEVESARAAGDEVSFLFYYSGHADDDGLQLFNTWVTFAELEVLLESTGADVRLAFVDACNSGALTRQKGGVRAPSFVFEVSERLGAEGTVIITSSTSDEASQESDEIGGSYFTYYLVGGLYGAADQNGDSAVTLSEAYDYVYRETVLRTAASRAGTQHPTFEWDLAGEGDVVLTDLGGAEGTLIFPAGLEGPYAVFDVDRRAFVGEVDPEGLERRLAIRPGRYLVQRRLPTHLIVADVKLAGAAEVDVSTLTFEPVEYGDDVAKGAMEKRIRVAERPNTAIRMILGAAAPPDEEVKAQYMGGTGLAGAGVRADWDRKWAGVDVVGGTWTSTIQPAGTLSIETDMTMTSGGIEAGYSTRPAAFRAGVGLRMAVTWIHREFPEAQQVPSDYILTVSPGLVAFVGWWPGRFQMDLGLRSMRVPYQLDEARRSFQMNEVVLATGWRF